MRTFLLLCGSCLALTGCVTTAFGSAPSPREGWVYVVGSRDSDPMVWHCPISGDGECEVVTVTEGNR